MITSVRTSHDHDWCISAQVDKVMHDGSLMTGVSSGIQLGSKVLLGSPNAKGVLVCG